MASGHFVASVELALASIKLAVVVGIAGDHILVHLDHLFVHLRAKFVFATIAEEHLDLDKRGFELA